VTSGRLDVGRLLGCVLDTSRRPITGVKDDEADDAWDEKKERLMMDRRRGSINSWVWFRM
jgi:hypothetical protein